MAEYFTGTLEAHRAKDLEEHSASCKECGEEFAEYKRMMTALAEPIVVPKEFRDQLKRIVIKEAKRSLPTATSFRCSAPWWARPPTRQESSPAT